jgi:iron complex transport system ATP-binding protein
MTKVLSTRNLAIGYGKRVLASDIDASLRAGELTCLIGPNGTGKSTLLRTLAGMQAPLVGRVAINDQDVHRLPAQALAKRLSVVLTERVDVGSLSAYALVALGRYPYTDWTGRLTAHDEDRVMWAMRQTGCFELAPRHVHELSDGERQRVMIARALAQEPQAILLDEPTAFLDLPGRVEVMHLLHRLARETERAILLSTHDLDLALRYADRLWLMGKGGVFTQGAPDALKASGDIACVFHTESLEAARYVSQLTTQFFLPN